MEKKVYRLPQICIVEISNQCILSASDENLPFDPNDDTIEALSKQIDDEPEWEQIRENENTNNWNLW